MGEFGGFYVSSESAMAAGVAMGIMILPLVSLTDDCMTAVPLALETSYGLGATQAEPYKSYFANAFQDREVYCLLHRVLSEDVIVVMAAGLAANLTVTLKLLQQLPSNCNIVNRDQEFDSAKTLAAFALGISLFLVTLVLNVIALIVRAYREKYD